jgi:glycosyltransferase involved in cell wall biosynthesis
MTSFSESFGLVLIEAENYGLPLVAFSSAQGAHEIILNNKNGFLIENRNKTEMANCIIKLIENQNLRKEMGQCGKKMSKKYCKENVSKQWNNFLNNI